MQKKGEGAMRTRTLALVLILMGMVALQRAPQAMAARHHSYVGTITSISPNALTIHSKTHNANFHFVIDTQTKFLQRGKEISRSRFHVGSYVSVSYSAGAHNSMIAYHISLRR